MIKERASADSLWETQLYVRHAVLTLERVAANTQDTPLYSPNHITDTDKTRPFAHPITLLIHTRQLVIHRIVIDTHKTHPFIHLITIQIFFLFFFVYSFHYSLYFILFFFLYFFPPPFHFSSILSSIYPFSFLSPLISPSLHTVFVVINRSILLQRLV